MSIFLAKVMSNFFVNFGTTLLKNVDIVLCLLSADNMISENYAGTPGGP